MVLKMFVCVLVMIDAVWCLGLPRKLHNRFDSFKKKINKLMHGREGNELFLDIDELEYPRANETLRQVYTEQWNEYYACLRTKLKNAGPEKTTFPIALMALEGTSVTMKCKLCVSPAELHTSESIEWFFNSSSNASIADVPIETSEHILVTPAERDLYLYSVQINEGGIYWCQLEDTASAPYYLHVANNEMEKTRAVRPETATGTENHPAPPENLAEYGIRVFSFWSSWSPCSQCDKVGLRIRYGYCMISLISNNAKRYIANESTPILTQNRRKRQVIDEETTTASSETTSEILETTTSDDKSTPILTQNRRKRQVIDEETTTASSETTSEILETTTSDDVDEEIGEKEKLKSPEELRALARSVLPIFRNRLPCRSLYTPQDIQKIEQIAERRTEIMTGFCKVQCEKNMIFEIRDKSGNVLESANNSAGIYSMVQGMPDPQPSVERMTIYHKHGKKAELTCPGNLNSDVPVVWQIGTKILVPSIIKKETNGRISVNSLQHIIFKKLRFADSSIYSCWQRGELAGTIRLEITDEVELKVDHRVFMIGAVIIVGVFLRIFWRAYRGRKRYTIH